MSSKANTYTHTADEVLMHLIGKGNKPAFDELYARYHKRLLFFMYKLLNYNQAKAQDLLHDIFVQLIEKPQQFDTTKKFSTWLYTLAKNQCYNYLRNTANRERLKEDAAQQMETIEHPTIPAEIDKKIFSNEVNQLLHTLSEKEQLLLALRFQQELPIKEIAQILQCPEGTVKSGLYYLLKKLAERMPQFNPKKQ